MLTTKGKKVYMRISNFSLFRYADALVAFLCGPAVQRDEMPGGVNMKTYINEELYLLPQNTLLTADEVLANFESLGPEDSSVDSSQEESLP